MSIHIFINPQVAIFHEVMMTEAASGHPEIRLAGYREW
jgi:hypothetical protein